MKMTIRYEIDEEHQIVDFYIEDDSGKGHHAGLTFKEAQEFLENILWEMKNPQEE